MLLEEGRSDIVVLATKLAAVGYQVAIRTAIGGGAGQECFRNLRHEFLVIAWDGEDLLVEPQFRHAQHLQPACRNTYQVFFELLCWNSISIGRTRPGGDKRLGLCILPRGRPVTVLQPQTAVVLSHPKALGVVAAATFLLVAVYILLRPHTLVQGSVLHIQRHARLHRPSPGATGRVGGQQGAHQAPCEGVVHPDGPGLRCHTDCLPPLAAAEICHQQMVAGKGDEPFTAA